MTVTPKRFNATFAAVWIGWLVLWIPFVSLLLPIAHASATGEFIFVCLLLVYFFAPSLLISWLD